MKSCHAVHGESGYYGKMRHLNLSVVDDRHLADLLLITGISALNLVEKSPVDLLNDLIDPGQQS